MIETLLLLGATGDLTRRYLLPALGSLAEAGLLPEGFRIIGAARTELDDDGFRRLAGDALPPEALAYRPVDLADAATLAAALDGVSGPVAAYLALPPGAFDTTIRSIAELDLPRGSRVAIEKPFGQDAASARALNDQLQETGLDVHRVDHVLGMETTANLVALRGNPVLERLWDAKSVEQVEVLWEETLGLEGRAEFYDRAGALVDVLQNHMLQLLALVAMDPADGDAGVHDRKREVLEAVRIGRGSRRARYTAGTLADGREVPAYADEEGVDPARGTETFAEVTLGLEMPRWRGTRFVLRAGKALDGRRKLVRLRFRGGGELEVGIDDPLDVVLRLTGAAGEPVALQAPAPGPGLPAYAHVLLDVLRGTSTLSVGAAEAEAAWSAVAPVLAAWRAGEVPLEEYPAGSTGPAQPDG